ncbi:MAG: hypothetical protein NWP47_03855 [Rickettsiaceae bacterium]|nr:hypothetical protein [Rickettsiaceae bacterium]
MVSFEEAKKRELEITKKQARMLKRYGVEKREIAKLGGTDRIPSADFPKINNFFNLIKTIVDLC